MSYLSNNYLFYQTLIKIIFLPMQFSSGNSLNSQSCHFETASQNQIVKQVLSSPIHHDNEEFHPTSDDFQPNHEKIIIICMQHKLIISISEGESFPFEGVKPEYATIVVRTAVPISSSEEAQIVSRKITALMKVDSPFLLPLVRVLEHRRRSYELDYQYVAEPLKHSPRQSESAFLPQLREKLAQFFHSLTAQGIKGDIGIESIGLNEQGDPQVYLGLNFKLLPENERKNLINEYQILVDKLIENNFNYRQTLKAPSEHSHFSDYSIRLDKKLNELEDKIQRMRGKRSSSKGGRSDKSKRSRECNIVMESLTKRNDSLSSGTTSNSLIACNPNSKLRVHKSSFGDYSTTSYRLNEETREDSLTKRISSALEKTQLAFKTYERYSRRKRRV